MTIDYTYDPLGRLTSADYSDGRAFTYTYDAAGNVQQYTQVLGSESLTTTYTYDDANELVTAQVGSSAAVHYTYDGNGNLLNDGSRSYTYDSANRLISATGGLATTTMSYNGLGQRLSMNAGGVTTQYALDSGQVLEATSGGQTTVYLYGVGPIGQLTDTWAYDLADGTNTPRQLTDAQGAVTFAASYTPWGDTLETHGRGNISFGYLGGLMDTATGLNYMGNGQYYDQATGRFLNRNTSPNSTNPYIPWGGNPSAALMAPLALLSLIYSRRKKRGKLDTFIIMLVIGISLSLSLASCGPGPITVQTPTPLGTLTITITLISTPSETPTYAFTATPPPSSTPTQTPYACTGTATQTPPPTADEWLKNTYGVLLLNGSDEPDGTWTPRRINNARRAVTDVAQKLSAMTGKNPTDAFRDAFDTQCKYLVMKKVYSFEYNGHTYTGGGVTLGTHLIVFAWIDYVRDDSMRNNIVHELGHAFSSAHNFKPQGDLPQSFLDNRDAFLHDNSTVMWQAHRSSDPGETFADMFLASTYGVWRDPMDIDRLKAAAPNNPEYWDPPKWMDNHLSTW